jgi:hypothetical protein
VAVAAGQVVWWRLQLGRWYGGGCSWAGGTEHAMAVECAVTVPAKHACDVIVQGRLTVSELLTAVSSCLFFLYVLTYIQG